ncbi:amine sulfotransferase-like [Alligator sinensis]|uniref:Sulfotransferase n=1 Tax=Alligator sinensis TaxID=38654 RepID=A0A1U7S5Z7_ALLSI|nr:amine sulfotransferase-like [Alligator sinensis]
MAEMETTTETSNKYLFKFKGFNFQKKLVTPDYLETMEDFETRDGDVFIITYPKSGTLWTQHILALIHYEGHRNGTENTETRQQIPFFDYNTCNLDFTQWPSPRMFCAHLPYYLVPKTLRNQKGKIIYVYRNPKDVLVSFFHFSKVLVGLGESPDLEHFLERFLSGNVTASSWFDHVRGWYMHKDEFNILFLSYEEMIKDLRTAVLKICNLVGKQLSDQEVDIVVDWATFKNMKADLRANYESLPEVFLKKGQGHFLRKGTTGDWKNIMTVAQSERFDKIFQEKMKDLPYKFIWDINEI